MEEQSRHFTIEPRTSMNPDENWLEFPLLQNIRINRRTPSVLIISDRWGNPFQGGIPAAIRIFASIFHSFGMSTYCTVLQKTHEEEQEAKTFNVRLICPEPRGSLQRTNPDSTWLLSHEAHFQNLKTRAQDIDVVLGFGLTTSEGAMFIGNLEYRHAKYYIANLWPPDEILEITGVIGCSRQECEKRIEMLHNEVSKASLLISIDENTYEYWSQMSPEPSHVQVLPQPNERYYGLNPPKLPEKDNPTYRVLSFLEEHEVDEFCSHGMLADAMNLVAEQFKLMNKTPPKWTILGVPEGKDRSVRQKLNPHSHLNMIPRSLQSATIIEQELQSSHLVLIPESPGMNSLNIMLSVMAIGIPLITKRYSPCHKLIKKFITNEERIEHMLAFMNPDDPQELRDKILYILSASNLRRCLKSAEEIKTSLKNSILELPDFNNEKFKDKIEWIMTIKNRERAARPFLPSTYSEMDNQEGREFIRHAATCSSASSTDKEMDNPEEREFIRYVGILGKRGAGHFSDGNEEHKVGILGKRGAGHFSDGEEEHKGRQKLRVKIKGGIPKKGHEMADVEHAYYALCEVQKAVPEQLNSSHPDLTIAGVSTSSVIYTIHCKTLDALEFLWQQYESLELKKLITSVTITTETLRKIGALYLEIQTALDIEEYDKCKMELLKKGQILGAPSPAQKEDESERPEMVIARAEKLQSECDKLRKENVEKDAEIRALKARMEKFEDEEKKPAGMK